jgi:hypothetical protein
VKKTLMILALAIMSLTTIFSIACEDHIVVNSDPGNSYPMTLIDTSVAIGSGRWILQDLAPGDYDVRINTDDAVEIKWIGGGVDSIYNTKVAVYEYIKQGVPVSEPVTLKIYNPTGIFFNPSALVCIKIVKVH